MEELKKELAAARMDADGLRAKLSALRMHSRALEVQLSSARSGTSLQDIQAVAGKDKKLVRDRLSDASLLLVLMLTCPPLRCGADTDWCQCVSLVGIGSVSMNPLYAAS